ncbi:TonB-dependent receptor [Qipengyuania sp. 6B39]|uniref:YaiO family outer membrane beta-barrel protein n=1 Tax=Qipengyuania proteolytica TaxID=2867239 RepID=UPI001C8A84E9|nr:YaiO family outer membrane beta-barrel protein [Qipengyuania proteolytica]MBX7497011.1 TonB-dependent receptor [Qipengyuania proteolytica]
MLIAAGTAATAQSPNGYEQAVDARRAGDPASAIALLQDWVIRNPNDVDARVQLGYAYLALDRLNEAQREFETVLAQAPSYRDASEALEQISRRRAARPAGSGFVLADGAISGVSSGLQDWHEAGLTLVAPLSAVDTIEVRGTWYERFSLVDIELGTLITHHAGEDLWLRAGANATPSADFRPEIGLSAGLDYRLRRGPTATIAGFDAAWRSFPTQDVWNLAPFVTQYFGSEGEFSATARTNILAADGDSLRVGGSVRADYAPGDRTRVFFGAAAGPDTDVGVVTDTFSLFGGGEIPLGDKLSLTGSLAREWRDGPADRTEFRAGLKVGL